MNNSVLQKPFTMICRRQFSSNRLLCQYTANIKSLPTITQIHRIKPCIATHCQHPSIHSQLYFSTTQQSPSNNTDKTEDIWGRQLPGRPSFMQPGGGVDDGDELYEDEIEVLEIGADEIRKQRKSAQSHIWNPLWVPKEMNEEDFEVELETEEAEAERERMERAAGPQHRIIKSKVHSDVVVEVEQITVMERLYSWFLLGVAFYLGRLIVRVYYMYTTDYTPPLTNTAADAAAAAAADTPTAADVVISGDSTVLDEQLMANYKNA